MEYFDIFQETPKPEPNKEKSIDKDKTFNRLKKLQSLIKKLNSLKEICK